MLTATATAHLTELHGCARPGASGREAEVVATAANIGIHSFVVAGALSFSVFASSAATQMFSAALRPSVQQVGGLVLLAVGLVLVIGAILASSLAFLVTGGIVAGAGVGVVFKFAVGAVVRIAPPETRGEALAGLFLGGWIIVGTAVVAARTGLARAD